MEGEIKTPMKVQGTTSLAKAGAWKLQWVLVGSEVAWDLWWYVVVRGGGHKAPRFVALESLQHLRSQYQIRRQRSVELYLVLEGGPQGVGVLEVSRGVQQHRGSGFESPSPCRCGPCGSRRLPCT